MPETPEASPPTDETNALPPGTRFGELEILRTIGIGGFGIVYLAQDHALERQVAIKEYMPGQMAQRSGGSQVSLRSASYSETFDIGRRSFVNEARLLARFDHRSLLKVYRFWEANGTAYMLMPYLHGQTLQQARKAMNGRPSEAWLRGVLLPLLDGLELLHAESVYHRDISPDNIVLPDGGGAPILLDFGAARRAIGDSTQTFTAILKPRFAPIEQYGEAAGLRQGPWTDLYALGAVMHFMLLGQTPPAATTRTVADSYQPLARMGLAEYSADFLAALDWMLGVRPQDRPQSAAELRAALAGQRKPPPPPAPVAAPADDDRTVVIPREAAESKPALAPTRAAPKPARGEPAKPAARTGFGITVAGAAALAVAGVTWWVMRPGPSVSVTPSAPAASAVVAAAPAASGTDEATAGTPASAPAMAAASASSAEPPSSTPALAAAPAAKPPPTVRAGGAQPADTKPRETRPAPRPEANLPAPAATTEPAPVQPAPSATAAAPTPAQASATRPLDPDAVCGGRVLIALNHCMDKRCAMSEYAAHPRCVKWRKENEDSDRYGK